MSDCYPNQIKLVAVVQSLNDNNCALNQRQAHAPLLTRKSATFQDSLEE